MSNNLKTQLADYILWYDGTIEIDPDKIPNLILSGVPIDKICSTRNSNDLQIFNNLEESPILIGKKENSAFDLSWNIPQEYLDLDLNKKILSLCSKLPDNYQQRVRLELNEISKRKLENLFRAIFYIVDTFKKENCVWGVGRGSSCACLILYLIGLHKVDPVKYGIEMSEFFHD